MTTSAYANYPDTKWIPCPHCEDAPHRDSIFINLDKDVQLVLCQRCQNTITGALAIDVFKELSKQQQPRWFITNDTTQVKPIQGE